MTTGVTVNHNGTSAKIVKISGPRGPSGLAIGDTNRVATLAALRNVDGNTYTSAYMLGHSSQNDGGEGLFTWDAGSSATDNGGTIIKPNGTSGAGRWRRMHNPNEYHVAWFGIFGVGADEGATLNTVISALGADTTLTLGDGTYILETGAALTDNYVLIGGQGAERTILKAKNSSDFLSVVSATNLTGVHLMNLTIDANRANRSGSLSQRAMGIAMTGMTDLRLVNVTVKNTYGFGGTSAVGIAVSGASVRCQAIGCTLINCGVAGHASDGIFFSGTDMLIDGCTADTCTDTGFVLEKCNNSRIQNCVTRSCNAAAAITSALASTNYANNSIDGLQVWGWNASNTGGIQIGAISTLSNLYNTSIANVNFYGSGVGTGPALYLRKTSTGIISGVNISNVNVYGGTAQGILVEAERVNITGCHIEGTAMTPIQMRDGASDVQIIGNWLEAVTGQFGIYIDGTAFAVNNVRCVSNRILGATVSGSYGIYWAGTNTGAEAHLNDIDNMSTARVGSDAGTVPIVNAPINLAVTGGFTFGKLADTNLYRNAADVLKTDDQMIATGGFVMKAKAGVPDDSDLSVVANNVIILDTTDSRLYARIGGTWKSVSLYTGPELEASFTWNPGNLVDGAGETSAAVTVTGAVFGDYVMVAAPYDLQGITCNGYVSAADAVKVRLQNETTGALDLASGSWKVRVIQ